MTKVFLVNDTDGEGDAYHAASTYKKAWKWIKNRQLEDLIKHEKSYGYAKSGGFRQHYEDQKELHPYNIQEMVVDEK